VARIAKVAEANDNAALPHPREKRTARHDPTCLSIHSASSKNKMLRG